MGSCISVPKKGILLYKKTHGNPNTNKKLAVHDIGSARRSATFNTASVLANPCDGSIFDTYRVGKELGRGEFGITHQCIHIESGETYACKKIAKQKLRTEIDVEDVRREVEIMRRLPKHPNIVSYKEAYEDKEAIYLVMELCEGGELFDRIVARGHYTERAAARVARTILEIVKVSVLMKLLEALIIWRRSAETEEGIAHAIVRGKIDFERDPWPKVSAEAKKLVKNMLDSNPYSRLTIQEVLEHPWIQNENHAPNVNLGDHVRTRIKQFCLMNKFKRKALRVVADKLPNEQLDGLKQLFYMMDTDNNGDLTFEELKGGLEMIGHKMSDPEVQMLMDAADYDGNGTLDCEEFVTMSVHLKRIGNDDILQQAFEFFDKNKTGYIEFDELREALLDEISDPSNVQIIQDIIFDVDLDKDGRICFQEFKAMMKTGTDWKMASRQYSRAMLNVLSIKMFKDKSLPLSGELFSPRKGIPV
ncbi:hypothetical protein EZV62_001434 [Acer yangbiense]|uniref:non-specific serine/threonine protein kinase n=1 Tax=Acer yangbiense TaxID=1000413 RepID=A0A5C7IUH9_9ROSI|nr:hypothetical protein EZV62_001434 [Acer yangbiense]